MSNELQDEKMIYLESGLNTIKIIVAISSFFGLLETVAEILDSFETISK